MSAATPRSRANTQLEHYATAVKKLAREKSNRLFACTNDMFALAAVSELISHCQNELLIFCDLFQKHYYELEKELFGFTSKGGNVKIIYSETDVANRDLLSKMKDIDLTSIRVLNSGENDLEKDPLKRTNFIVADRHAYFYETKERDIDSSVRYRFACFNDEKAGSTLASRFINIFESAEVLDDFVNLDSPPASKKTAAKKATRPGGDAAKKSATKKTTQPRRAQPPKKAAKK